MVSNRVLSYVYVCACILQCASVCVCVCMGEIFSVSVKSIELAGAAKMNILTAAGGALVDQGRG